MFAEAAAEAFAVVAVVYMDERLGMKTVEIGVFFMIGIFSLIPGTFLGDFVTARTNPNTSWKLSMLKLKATAVVGALTLNKENIYPGGYIWAVIIGISLGWFYSAEILLFSMCVPQEEGEAEIAGFYAYCAIILSWLPPLIFSVMVEAEMEQSMGVIAVSGFFTIGFLIMSMASPWEEILEEARSTNQNATEGKMKENEVVDTSDDSDNDREDENEKVEVYLSQTRM